MFWENYICKWVLKIHNENSMHIYTHVYTYIYVVMCTVWYSKCIHTHDLCVSSLQVEQMEIHVYTYMIYNACTVAMVCRHMYCTWNLLSSSLWYSHVHVLLSITFILSLYMYIFNGYCTITLYCTRQNRHFTKFLSHCIYMFRSSVYINVWQSSSITNTMYVQLYVQYTCSTCTHVCVWLYQMLKVQGCCICSQYNQYIA